MRFLFKIKANTYWDSGRFDILFIQDIRQIRIKHNHDEEDTQKLWNSYQWILNFYNTRMHIRQSLEKLI